MWLFLYFMNNIVFYPRNCYNLRNPIFQEENYMSKKKVVVALGHDALGSNTSAQLDAVKKTAKALADLVEANYQLTITHSNGHQVSMIHKAMTELRRVYPDYTPAPMCVCSAMSQGYVGYDIQNSLKSELLSRGISVPVSTILTQVTVDPYDEAFYTPQKAIGRYMAKEDADIEVNKGNYVVETSNGFRRVIAAPQPIDIVEIAAIQTLSDADQVVIACGGGGIPVIEQQHVLKGASAVIEKDCIAGKLATDLKADELLILTSVDYVYLNFEKENQEPLKTLTVADAKRYIAEGQFGETDMLPKILAAISYLEAVPNGRVIITSLNKTAAAIDAKIGTVITV
jgi:carbamate kinase